MIALVRVGGLAVVATLAYLAAGFSLDPVLTDPRAANVWFDSDLPYRMETMARPEDGMHHGGAHPLFPSIARALMAVARALTPGAPDAFLAARVALALAGGLWVVAQFLLFRKMGLGSGDATLFAALGAVSAGALFWFPVPETFALAGLGVTLALLVAASAKPSVFALAAGCVASAACILTNGVVGALAVAAHSWPGRRWKTALGALSLALVVMAGVWTAQEWGRGSPFFLSRQLLEYRQHTFPLSVERTARVVPALLSHPVVAPGLRNDRAKFRRMPPGSSGPLGAVATAGWWVLLGLGAVALAREARGRAVVPLAITAVGSLLFMLALHLTLGREMFLYAMDVLPLLLVVAAASVWPERGRRLVRVVACAVILLGGVNNARQFVKSADAANALAAQRVGR